MITVDDVREFLDERWTVLLWSDEGGKIYYALAIWETETTEHAMEQEEQMGKGDTPSEALRCLVEKMSGGLEMAAALLKVVTRLVTWHDECMRVDNHSPLPGELVSEARKALEWNKWKKRVGG